jgi:hypothetical protein
MFNSNGFAVVYDPNTRTTHSLVDDNNVPLPYGAAKTPPATHFSGRYPGADGYWHIYNTTTGEDKILPTRVPPKVAAAGSWQKIVDPKTGQITFYNPTTRETQLTPFTGHIPGAGTSAGTKAGPGTSTWRLTSNRVDTQLQQWAKPPTPAWIWDYVKGWVRKPGTGAVVKDEAGKNIPAGPEPKLYDDALQWALDQYQGPNTKAWQAHARKLVNDAYPMNGENGRPLEGGLAISAANDYAKAMLKRGVSAADALNAGLAQPYWRLDPSVLRKAITRVFPTPPKPLPPLGTIPTIPPGGLQVGGPPSAYAIP